MAGVDKFDKPNFEMAIYSAAVTKFSEFLNWNWKPNESIIKIHGNSDLLFNENIILKGENFSWSSGYSMHIGDKKYSIP